MHSDQQAVHYPTMPPRHNWEDPDRYTNRLLGWGAHTTPYNHGRGRQCSIGYHNECSQLLGGSTIGATGPCKCPHHEDARLAAGLPHIAGLCGAVAAGTILHTIDAEAVDVLIDAMAEMDAPLRELVTHWRQIGGIAADQAGSLEAVLEGRSRHRDGRWVIDSTGRD